MKRPLLVIPARGGSKRIPRKNIRSFLGKPILARVVAELKRSDRVGDVIVSTDDREIRSVAIEAGADVPFWRSEHTSSDFATLYQVVYEVLEQLGPERRPEYVMCALPTAVLLTADTVTQAIDEFLVAEAAGTADSLMSVQRYRHPIERAFRRQPDGTLVRLNEGSYTLRTQDLPPTFYDAGQFYLSNSAELLQRSSLMGARCVSFELGEFDAHDIDEEADWHVAELKYQLKNPSALRT